MFIFVGSDSEGNDVVCHAERQVEAMRCVREDVADRSVSAGFIPACGF